MDPPVVYNAAAQFRGNHCRTYVMLESLVPSLIFQVAIFPSVIVGESAGMLKLCAASKVRPE